MKKAIIFDLDGTLWDSVDQVVIAWNQVLAKYPEAGGLVLDRKMLEGIMGKQIAEIAAIFLPNVSPERGAEILNEGCEVEIKRLSEHGGKLYPMLEQTLKQLSEKYALMIVSNSQDGYVQMFLKVHHLEDYFCDYEMAGRTGKCKGENIRLVIARNGIEEATYIGDTESDYQAAKLAGVNFLHATYGFGSVAEDCETLTTFAELTKRF